MKKILLLAIILSMILTACGKPSPEEEKANFTTFYNEIISCTTQIDNLYDPISQALVDQDITTMIRLTQNNKRELLMAWGELDRIDVPKLISDENNEAIRGAHKDLSYAYMLKSNIPEKLVEYADTQKPSLIAEISQDQQDFQTYLLSAMGTITTIGINIGAVQQ